MEEAAGRSPVKPECVHALEYGVMCEGGSGPRLILVKEQQQGPYLYYMVPSSYPLLKQHQMISTERGGLAQLSIPWSTKRKGGQGKWERKLQVVVVNCGHHFRPQQRKTRKTV